MISKRDAKQANELMAIMCGKAKLEDCKVLGKPKRKHVQHEAKEQEAVFQWAEMQKAAYPELELLFAIPNGGSRNKLEAYGLKRQGVKSGVPDMFLPVSRNNFHGLWIEMKSEKGKVSENQEWWIEKLTIQVYKTCVCYTWIEAIDTIMWYLGLPSVRTIERGN